MKKRIVSLLMATVMMLSVGIYAFADTRPASQGTDVEYEGQGVNGIPDDKKPGGLTPDLNGEGYLITVPAQFDLNNTTEENYNKGKVEVTGVWCSNCNLSIELPKQVEMSTSINESEKINLDITFENETEGALTSDTNYSWVLDGNNQSVISGSADISVAPMTALFGDWTGRIDYTVSLNNEGHISSSSFQD